MKVLPPISTIHAELGIELNGRVQKFLVDTCARYMNKYVPLGDTGNLRKVIHKTANSITYEMPYAHAQYIGFTKGPVRNYTTPGTGPYWDKRMWSAEGQNVINEVQKYVNR